MSKKLNSFLKTLFSLGALRFFFILITLIVFGYGYQKYTLDPELPISYQEKFSNIFEKGDQPKLKEKVYSKLFDLKYAQYKENLAKFEDIQKWMLALLIISILVIVFGADKVPLFGFTIPDNLIYFIVFFGGLYFWANFGLTFSALIDDRLALYSYLDKIEIAQGKISYLNSPKHLLMDNSLMDNWFSYFFKIFEEEPNVSDTVNNIFGALGLYGIYAVILGLYKSLIFISVLEFIERKKLFLIVRIGLISFALAMTLTATAAFLLEKNSYATFWMGSIWLVVTGLSFFWHYWGQNIFKAHKIDRSSKSKTLSEIN